MAPLPETAGRMKIVRRPRDRRQDKRRRRLTKVRDGGDDDVGGGASSGLTCMKEMAQRYGSACRGDETPRGGPRSAPATASPLAPRAPLRALEPLYCDIHERALIERFPGFRPYEWQQRCYKGLFSRAWCSCAAFETQCDDLRAKEDAQPPCSPQTWPLCPPTSLLRHNPPSRMTTSP